MVHKPSDHQFLLPNDVSILRQAHGRLHPAYWRDENTPENQAQDERCLPNQLLWMIQWCGDQ